MFGKFSEQLKSTSKPVHTMFAVNTKTLESLSQHQTTLFAGLLSDGVRYMNAVTKQTEMKAVLSANAELAESVRDRMTSASKDTYSTLNAMREEMTEVVKASLSMPAEASAPVAEKAAAAKKTPVAKSAPVKKQAEAKAPAVKKAATQPTPDVSKATPATEKAAPSPAVDAKEAAPAAEKKASTPAAEAKAKPTASAKKPTTRTRRATTKKPAATKSTN